MGGSLTDDPPHASPARVPSAPRRPLSCPPGAKNGSLGDFIFPACHNPSRNVPHAPPLPPGTLSRSSGEGGRYSSLCFVWGTGGSWGGGCVLRPRSELPERRRFAAEQEKKSACVLSFHGVSQSFCFSASEHSRSSDVLLSFDKL